VESCHAKLLLLLLLLLLCVCISVMSSRPTVCLMQHVEVIDRDKTAAEGLHVLFDFAAFSVCVVYDTVVAANVN